MSAVPLARLRGASTFEAVERSCPGAAEGLEIRTASPLLSGSGHSGRLALSSGQRSLPAPAYNGGTTTRDRQRLPLQAEVSLSMQNCCDSLIYTAKGPA